MERNQNEVAAYRRSRSTMIVNLLRILAAADIAWSQLGFASQTLVSPPPCSAVRRHSGHTRPPTPAGKTSKEAGGKGKYELVRARVTVPAAYPGTKAEGSHVLFIVDRSKQAGPKKLDVPALRTSCHS